MELLARQLHRVVVPLAILVLAQVEAAQVSGITRGWVKHWIGKLDSSYVVHWY